MQQKNLIIIVIAVIAAIIIGGGGYYFLSKSTSKPVVVKAQQGDQQVLTLQPTDIGLTLTTIASGKLAQNGVDMKITNLTNITSIDYELDYIAKGGIPRGAIGHIDIKSTDSAIDQQLAFGTCSDVCHFDQEVTGVKVTLKLTKSDGKLYQIVAPFTLGQ